MSASEIDILVLRALDKKTPKSTSTIAGEVRKIVSVSESEVFDVLVRAVSAGQVMRTRTDEFDESRPVSTASWILMKDIENELPSPLKRGSYIEEAMIVVSQPIFLSVQGVDLRSLGMPMLNVREAMEKLVLDARQELRIACPYYDELFIDVLSSHAQNVSKLNLIAVLAETMDPVLVKAQTLFRNLKIKALYRGASGGANNLKVQGVHAKIMIADRSEVLIGSFNFRFSHLNYNVDLGLLATGEIADHYARIYDSIWGSQ
jgi:hypothetical protein